MVLSHTVYQEIFVRENFPNFANHGTFANIFLYTQEFI